jgi:hypothetical protein
MLRTLIPTPSLGTSRFPGGALGKPPDGFNSR